MLKGEFNRRMFVCIDNYENNNPAGRFCSPDGKEQLPFQSLTQLLSIMEHRLNITKFPQAFEELRSFGAPRTAPFSEDSDTPLTSGSLATFTVRVMFRQNASWQGSILWQEGKQEESFRSVLEMIFLLDSALTQSAA